jgi:hypothetical protein
MLVAIFRARPSPFYVLDEVEEALDEVNLTRLVDLLHELRNSSQLLVITHQKYTMEAADVLYGVSMRGDGISQVISQRIRPQDGTVVVRGGGAGEGAAAGGVGGDGSHSGDEADSGRSAGGDGPGAPTATVEAADHPVTAGT